MHDKEVSIVYYVKNNKPERQSIRFPKATWTAAEARGICEREGGSFEAASTEEHNSPMEVKDMEETEETMLDSESLEEAEAKYCKCPECDTTIKGELGKKCTDMACPKCGAKMEGPFCSETTEGLDLDKTEQQIAQSGDIDEILSLVSFTEEAAKQNPDFMRLVSAAKAKYEGILREDRQPLWERFEAIPEVMDETSDGAIHFKAGVGIVDIPTGNNRIYSQADIEKNIQRIKKESVPRGKFVGEADHPVFGVARIRETSIKWEDLWLEGKTLFTKGKTLSTLAGKDIASLIRDGIGLEFSQRGWGKPEKQENGTYLVRNYILTGIDCVLGASVPTTGIIQTETLEVQDVDKPVQKEEVKETETNPEATIPETQPEVANPEPQPEVKEPEKPITEVIEKKKVDEDSLMAKIEARQTKREAEQVKEELTHDLPNSERDIINSFIANAQTPQEVRAAYTEAKTLLNEVRGIRDIPAGVGVITAHHKRKRTSDFWWVGTELKERPQTVDQAVEQLLEGLPNDGTMNCPYRVMEQIIGCYTEEAPSFLDAVTVDGYRRISEATTTTTALGTLYPQVLPIIRRVVPKLLGIQLVTVMRMRQSTARIPKLKVTDESTGSDLSELSWNDSITAYTEAGTAKELSFDLATRYILTAEERKVSLILTHEVIEDARNEFGLDAQREIMEAGADILAKEINSNILKLILDAGTAGQTNSATFGTAPPAAWTYQDMWRKQLAAYIENQIAEIVKDTQLTPSFIVCLGVTASLVSQQEGFKAERQDILGGQRTGSLLGMDVYHVPWITDAKIIVGAKGPVVNPALVYAPYVPLDIVGPIPTLIGFEHALRRRDAMVLVDPEAFSIITVSTAEGTDPWS